MSLIFLRLGAEFVALLYLIIYIGAIFILFIFIIMMLNLRLIFLYTNLSVLINNLKEFLFENEKQKSYEFLKSLNNQKWAIQ